MSNIREGKLSVNFNGLNVEFGRLQNIELTSSNFDGEFADLASPAITKCKGALLLLMADNGYTSIKAGIRYKNDNQDLILFALSKNTQLTSGTATSGSTTTLVKTGASWIVNAYQNKYLKYTKAKKTYYCLISSNTEDTLTIPLQGLAIDNTVTFEILESDALYVYDIEANTLTLLKANLAPNRRWTGAVASSYIGSAIESGGSTQIITGTATGGTTSTLVKTSAAWTVNAYQNKIVKYTVNDNDFYVKIKSNTADTLTFDRINTAPVSGTEFVIYEPIKPYITGTWTSAGVFNTNTNISTLTNTSLNYYDDVLYGRYMYANTTDATSSGSNAGDLYQINKNTGSYIYVSGNCTVASGKAYKIIHASYQDKFQDSSKNWNTENGGQFAGKYLYIKAGRGAGQLRQIVYNDIDTLYLKLSWSTVPDETSQYEIYDTVSQVLYLGNGIDWIQRYNGTTISDLKNRPKGEYLYLFQNRLFVTGDIALPYKGNFSEIEDYEFFPVQNFFVPNGSDVCTGYCSFDNKLFVFKRRTLHELVEGTINNYTYFIPKLKENANGCISQHASASVQLKGGTQVWYSDGRQVSSLGYSANFVGAILTSSVSSLIDDTMQNGLTQYYNDQLTCNFDGRYFWIAFPKVNEYADFAYRYDTKYSVWTSRTGLNIGCFVKVDEKTYMGTSNGVGIYLLEQNQLYDGTSSAKVAIDQHIILKGTYATSRFTVKQHLRSRFLFDREEEDTSASLSVILSQAMQNPVRHSKNINIGKVQSPVLLDDLESLDEGTELDRVDTMDTPFVYIYEPELTSFLMYKFELRNNAIDDYYKLLNCDIIVVDDNIENPLTIN